MIVSVAFFLGHPVLSCIKMSGSQYLNVNQWSLNLIFFDSLWPSFQPPTTPQRSHALPTGRLPTWRGGRNYGDAHRVNDHGHGLRWWRRRGRLLRDDRGNREWGRQERNDNTRRRSCWHGASPVRRVGSVPRNEQRGILGRRLRSVQVCDVLRNISVAIDRRFVDKRGFPRNSKDQQRSACRQNTLFICRMHAYSIHEQTCTLIYIFFY